jgi:hypothetical protein
MGRLLVSVMLIQVAVLLAARPLIWWYFGIGRAVRALENIDASLRVLPAVRRADYSSGRKPPRAA